jgi:two-component system cell cycle sensor histidine kinase/response regulator CckA
MLALRNIAREHQGAFRVWRDEERGNTFSLYLPFSEPAKHAVGNNQDVPVSGKGHLVLLVDDEPTIRSILRQGLETSGYAVIEAPDGVDGFATFVRHRASISCVLLDLTMPRMNGDEVYREIRRLSPHMPVILMSGYGKQESLASIDGNVAGFVHKPCSVKDVLVAVHKALEVPALV